MFFLGLIHGRPEDEIYTSGEASNLALSRQQLRDTFAHLLFAPITLEHKGIHTAFKTAKSLTSSSFDAPVPATVSAVLKLQAERDPKHAILGEIVDFFEVPSGGFYIVYKIPDELDSIVFMIINGLACGLSLTHYELNHTGNIMPYEVSLCYEPARPHCYTIVGSSSLQRVLNYKRSLMTGRIPDPSLTLKRQKVYIMSEAPELVAASKSPVEEALSTIPDENARKILAERMGDLMRMVDTTESKNVNLTADNKALNEKLSAASAFNFNAEAQAQLLKSQLDLLTTSLGVEKCKKFGLSNDVTHAAIDSGDYNQLARLMDRTLVACSRQFMEMSAQPEAPSPMKRAAAEQITPQTAAVVEEVAEELTAASAPVAAPAMTPEDYLARAMASTARSFRGTRVSGDMMM